MTGTVTVIGCGVLRQDITAIAEQQGFRLVHRFLPGGLHNRPQELRRRLQAAIDEISSDQACSRIVIGYGLCGMGTVNIRARRIPLIIPRVHDCIALFLGGDQAYRQQFAEEPGTYYISAGWCIEQMANKSAEEKISIGSESMGSRQLSERYGQQAAGRIADFFSSWKKNYRRAAFIDTGVAGAARASRKAEEMARANGWRYDALRGDLSLLTRLLTTETSTDEILVVPPEYTTLHDAANNRLDAAPADRPTESGQSRQRSFTIGSGLPQSYNIRFGLGIDAGGTYTDAVIHDFTTDTIIAKHKAPTTKWNFSIGIAEALAGLPTEYVAQVELVAVSTTLATNAIVENEGQPTGLIVMTGPKPRHELFPHRPCAYVAGQMNMDGIESEPIDPDEIRAVARRMVDSDGVGAFAVSGFAATINPRHELQVQRLLQEATGRIVCCGHELSDQLNLAVRAQTAVLNARIIPRMLQFFDNLAEVLAARAIEAPVMVVKGDGTLMSVAMAKEKPVETILSGPAASVAGAKFLTGITEGIVVDMGGTTTDTAAIGNGQVIFCDQGARVGRHQTHVRALQMRTIGLGGDSLVVHDRGQLRIGPRRVMPLVATNAVFPGCLEHTVQNLQGILRSRPKAPVSQQLLVATGGVPQFETSETETQILSLLINRAYSLDELSSTVGLRSHQFLQLDRLERAGLIQRCGLTPTDLLHADGRLTNWPVGPALQWLQLLGIMTGREVEELAASLLKEVERGLAMELLRKQLAEETDIDRLEDCPLCRHLADKLLSDDNGPFTMQVRMTRPVIGIGAPIGHFLPRAAELLGAQSVIPEHAEVANALGAITSTIRLHRQRKIRTNDRGRFLVEGDQDGHSFTTVNQAEEWAVTGLVNELRQLGRRAGTSNTAVEFTVTDSTAPLTDGNLLFLGRTLQASLTGLPDLLFQHDRQNPPVQPDYEFQE